MSEQTRRDFLKQAGKTLSTWAGLSVFPGALSAQPSAGKQDKPNVLILMCDQLNAGVLGCYGGPVLTPNIDRLARNGVLFTNAICTTPYCCPSRASLVTGLYPHQHGVVINIPYCRGLNEKDVTTEKLLHEAGYATRHAGQWHLEESGHDSTATAVLSYYPDMYRIHVEYKQQFKKMWDEIRCGSPDGYMNYYGLPLPVEVSPAVREARAKLGNRWEKEKNGGVFTELITKMGRLTLPLDHHLDVCVATHSIRQLNSLPKDKPFMATCSFVSPHDPSVVPLPYYEMYAPDRLRLPENYNVNEKRYEKDWSRKIVVDLGEPVLREFLRIYYALIRLVDDQVGRVLKALDETGQADKTIVIFTADHGDMAGGHGMLYKATNSFYDEIMRVPLIIRYPRRLKPHRTELAADNTCIMPTILELTGQPIPGHVAGHSLVPYLTGQFTPAQAPAYAFCERGISITPMGSLKPKDYCIRGQGWKYMRFSDGAEFLYHLARDPGETKNLAGQTTHQSIQTELSDRIDKWLRSTRLPSSDRSCKR